MQQQNSARRASIYLGVFMAVVLVGSALLQLLGNDQRTAAPAEQATATLVPTFPPPLDVAVLDFSQVYLHPSGLYALAQPTGFASVSPSTTANIAQVNMVNNDSLMVVDAFVEDASGQGLTSASLSDRFTQQVLDQSWARFNDWTETNRRVENDQLIIDFQVTLQNQTYAARQKAWTDGDWVYAVRVLAPSNATQSLTALLDQVVASVQPFKQFAGTPFIWQAYYDQPANHIIRHPQAWRVTDSAPGRPATITGNQGETLRVESRAGTSVADAEAAAAFAQTLRSGATILSTLPVERGDLTGFNVAYSTTSADGEPESGLVTLLNGADNLLHIANLRFPGESINLNAVHMAIPASDALSEATAEPVAQDPTVTLYRSYAQVNETFSTLPPLNLSPASLPPTPTPRPTLAPTPEATAESTAEATIEMDATAEMSATAEMMATDEMTATALAPGAVATVTPGG